MTLASLNSNHYSSTTYLSINPDLIIDKTKKTVVLVVDEIFQWQRVGEEALYEALTDNGFTDVVLFSDYARFKDYSLETGKSVYDVVNPLDAGYFIYGGVVGSYYTYHYGGDLSTFTVDTTLVPLSGQYSYELAVQASTVTEAKENNMIGFTKSLEDAFKSYADSFVKKLIKY